ncbi:MAG: hypothetical protein JWP12_1375 [Bacteroidetes bacterium]|nr:hypothetical protein [Bacteroidota bacterium]
MEALHLQYLAAAFVYAVFGIITLVLAFWLIDKMTPRDLWKEIIDKQNMAFAVLASAFMIAIGLIISSAIHG